MVSYLRVKIDQVFSAVEKSNTVALMKCITNSYEAFIMSLAKLRWRPSKHNIITHHTSSSTTMADVKQIAATALIIILVCFLTAVLYFVAAYQYFCAALVSIIAWNIVVKVRR